MAAAAPLYLYINIRKWPPEQGSKFSVCDFMYFRLGKQAESYLTGCMYWLLDYSLNLGGQLIYAYSKPQSCDKPS